MRSPSTTNVARQAATQNLYSSYLYAEYPIYRYSNWRFDLGVGAAFALNGDGSGVNFYGSKSGVVEVNMIVTYRLRLKNYEIPIFSRMMWNPDADDDFFQIGATILTLGKK